MAVALRVLAQRQRLRAWALESCAIAHGSSERHLNSSGEQKGVWKYDWKCEWNNMSAIPTKKAQVMLVDDHAMLRHGMAMLINLEHDMEVIAEAGDGEEALGRLKNGPHPDIVLMDVSLKTLSGFEVIKSMHSLIPGLPVL